MKAKFQAIKGMNDFLPEQTAIWQTLEALLRRLTRQYGYQEIRMPIVEKTALFKRSIGEVTDIVEKEMYTWTDISDDSLTLRPEGTASCVRAGIEHGLLYNQQQKLWYMGPMFRRENPQKGRYRQFHQFGIEAFGYEGPDIDVEQILFTHRLWQEIGISDSVTLHINSLGQAESRAAYKTLLVEYLTEHQSELDEDSLRRLNTNPLRILDSKNPAMQGLIERAPKLNEHLDEASEQHFNALKFPDQCQHHSHTGADQCCRGSGAGPADGSHQGREKLCRDSSGEDGQGGDQDRVRQSQRDTDDRYTDDDQSVETKLPSIIHVGPHDRLEKISNHRRGQRMHISVSGGDDGSQHRGLCHEIGIYNALPYCFSDSCAS